MPMRDLRVHIGPAFRFVLILMPVALAHLSVVSSCAHGSGGDSVAVPRPVAYPRPVLYDAVYRSSSGLPCGFEVNASAEVCDDVANVSRPGADAVWADIGYPAYGAVLRCTFTPVDDAGRRVVADNRVERMAMNLGDNAAAQTDVSSPAGYTGIILTSLGATITPLQFLSVGDRWVVSGALEMPAAVTSIDSVRPMIEAVKADMIHALANLE